MPDRFTHAELNRATLARQGLLDRRKRSVLSTLEAVAGLQAQEPKDPYVALYARVAGFRPSQLERLLMRRKAGRLALMRSTIHLVSARDAWALRPILQPVLERAYAGNHRKRLGGAAEGEVMRAGGRLLARGPITFGDLGRRLQERWPKAQAASLAQAVRAFVPLVQTPPRGLWSKTGQPLVVPAETWFEGAAVRPVDPVGLVRRYLAAFGPASVADAQTWSGLAGLAAAFRELGDDLVTFESPDGKVLYDLPRAPCPPGDTEAPPRFLPVYDNAILGYKDRRRIMPAKLPDLDLRVNEAVRFVTIDGVLGAIWKPEIGKRTAKLVVKPFVPISEETKQAVREEGEALLSCLWQDLDCSIQFGLNT